MTDWILGSASPRRREILQHLGLRFRVLAADTDETSEESDPRLLVEQLARHKAEAVLDRLRADGEPVHDGTVILTADTLVIGPSGEVLGKPHSPEEAAQMLHALSGNTHRVMSGVAAWRGGILVSAHEVTEVTFSPLDEETVARYIASREPYDKAGGYGIQDTAALWVSGIKGDYFNVVGLPVHRLETLLGEAFGLSLWQR